MTKKELLVKLKNIQQELSSQFGIEKIALFGSYAKEEAHKESDIDIAIINIKKKNAFTVIRAEKFLSEYLGKKVDLGLFDSIRPFIQKRIKDEMIHV